MKKIISLIVPCYNEQEVIKLTHERLMKLDLAGYEKQIIYINDGSADDTLNILRALAKEHDNRASIKVLSFSRNFGHQAAVTAGMAEADGDAAVIIDADLQDPPEVIHLMIQKWEEGYKVVYGKRSKREGETGFKLFTAWAYYRTLNKLSGGYIPKDTGDFRLIDRCVLDTMNSMGEHNRFLRGMGAWVGYKQCALEYERDERAAGETKYTLKKMLKLASDGIIAFSDKPLKLPLYSGVILFMLSFIYLIVSIVLTCVGIMSYINIVFSAVFIVLAMMLIFMGFMGLYLARIYDEAKNRPNYIIEERIEG